MELIFTPLNLNPKGKKASDCVIRAMAYATKQSWEDTYLEMAKLGIKEGLMINEKRLEEKYIKQKGFIKHKQPRTLNNKLYTIKDFIKEFGYEYEGKTIIFLVKRHLTVVHISSEESVAVLYDIWDCCNQYIRNYYVEG